MWIKKNVKIPNVKSLGFRQITNYSTLSFLFLMYNYNHIMTVIYLIK
jgi:hypothetical protein